MEVISRKRKEGILQIRLQEHVMELKLTKYLGSEGILSYQLKLTEDTLPSQLKSIDLDLARLYYAFEDEDFYQIDWEMGKLVLQYATNLGSMKKYKKVYLVLERHSLCDVEELKILLNLYREENQELKANNAKMENSLDLTRREMQEKKQNQNQNNLQTWKCFLMGISILFLCFSLFLLSQHQRLITQINKIKTSESQENHNGRNPARMPSNFDDYSPFIEMFAIRQDTVTYLGNYDFQYVQLMRDLVIPRDQVFTFEIFVPRMQNKKLLVGVVDRRTQQMARSSFSSGNAVAFSASFGTIYYGKHTKETGNSISQGSKIKVKINMMENSIEWSQNGIKIGQVKSELFNDPKRQLVPYIECMNAFDQIVWIP